MLQTYDSIIDRPKADICSDIAIMTHPHMDNTAALVSYYQMASGYNGSDGYSGCDGWNGEKQGERARGW